MNDRQVIALIIIITIALAFVSFRTGVIVHDKIERVIKWEKR